MQYGGLRNPRSLYFLTILDARVAPCRRRRLRRRPLALCPFVLFLHWRTHRVRCSLSSMDRRVLSILSSHRSCMSFITAPLTHSPCPQLFGSPRNITVPPNAYVGGKGSFSFPLLIAASKQFVLTMSDATGFGSGGSTPLLTTGPSLGPSTCNITDPGEIHSSLFRLNPSRIKVSPSISS